MTRYLITCACIVASALCRGQATKVLTAEKSNEYGIVYSLPQTALDVEITVLHQVAKKGPFSNYAKKAIGAQNVVTEDSEKWAITEVKVTPYGVADSGIQYLMQLKPGALTFVEVDADGMLLSINKRSEATPKINVKPTPAEHTKFPTGQEYLDFVDEEFVASQSKSRQARLLAESLMEVRDSKLSLTRGTADAMPTDGKQLELMLNSLSEQESALSAAFTGTLTTEYMTRHYSYVPETEGKEILFRLSDFAGFVEADDLSGEAVYVEIEIVNQAKLPVDAKGEPKKVPKNAIVYNLPGSAQVTISTLGNNLYDKEIQFSQFGTTFGLDPDLFTDKKAPSCATFNPVTGALIEIKSIKEL